MILSMLERIESLETEVIRLNAELEENRRVAANTIRLGVVQSAEAKTVSVKTGDNVATRIPFFVLCAGRVSHYRRPSVGEQCVLLNLGSGDNLNNAVALMGLPSTQYPVPTTAENEYKTDYGNGMSETYNLDAGSITANYPGGMKIIGDTEQVGNYRASGDVSDGKGSMKEDREVYNDHDHISPETRVPTSKPAQKQ